MSQRERTVAAVLLGPGCERRLAEELEAAGVSAIDARSATDVGALRRLVTSEGVPARRLLYVDSCELNVVAARTAGMSAFLHTDALSTRAALRALVAVMEPPWADGRARGSRGDAR